ncbi:MAG: VWA domain-containing protein [Pseudobdellovibrionaceae bacterium]
MKAQIQIVCLLAMGLSSCSPEATKQYVKPVASEKVEVTQDPNAQYFDPTVDILFVVDDSGSMYSHQSNLANNIALFTNKFSKKSVLKFNIGVVTTDMDCWPPTSCTSGFLVGTTKVVSNSTPNMNKVLGENFMVGTSGSASEESFSPVIEALSPANIAGPNAGFYRPGAALVVIFITDAEDQSNLQPKDFYNQLMTLKNQDARRVFAYGAIVPSSDSDCNRDDFSMKPVKIESFLSLVYNGANGQNVFSLCDPEYGKKLAGMAKDIVDEFGGVFYLDRMPIESTIRVTYGSADLPRDGNKGWSLDTERNAIVLGDNIDWASQPSGSRIMVNYEAAKAEVEK